VRVVYCIMAVFQPSCINTNVSVVHEIWHTASSGCRAIHAEYCSNSLRGQI